MQGSTDTDFGLSAEIIDLQEIRARQAYDRGLRQRLRILLGMVARDSLWIEDQQTSAYVRARIADAVNLLRVR
mgnify:CR=1 FL=1